MKTAKGKFLQELAENAEIDPQKVDPELLRVLRALL